MHKISKFFFFLSSFKFRAAITAVKLLLLFRNLLQLFLWLHHNFTRHQLPSLKPAPPLFSFFFFKLSGLFYTAADKSAVGGNKLCLPLRSQWKLANGAGSVLGACPGCGCFLYLRCKSLMNLFPEQGNYCRYSAWGWAADSQQDHSGLQNKPTLRWCVCCQSERPHLLHHGSTLTFYFSASALV